MLNKFENLSVVDKCTNFLCQTMAILEADLRKLYHDPYDLLARMIQPILWLLLFGQAMFHAHTINTGSSNYLNFIAPGILAQSILFVAIFYGISLIWDRDMGILYKIMVSPAPRSALVIGRALASGVRGLTQAIVIYLLAFFLDIDINFHPLALFGVVIFVFIGSAVFATISLIAASIVKKRERFIGIGQLLTMPLFFASNALYPINLMPKWLQILSHFNPLTYQVDAFRTLMIVGEKSAFGLMVDFIILFLTLCILIIIATKSYPKILN